jgi:spermidine synthase
VLYLVFILSGAAALIYQVLWARLLSLSFGVHAVSTTIVLASFMLGLALGAFLIGRNLGRCRSLLGTYAVLEAAIGVYGLFFADILKPVDRLTELLLSDVSPLWQSLAVRATLSFCLLIPPTTLMGATLPLLAEEVRQRGHATRVWQAGLLYSANTLGAVAGALLSGFVLIEVFGIQNTLRFAAALNLLTAGIALHLARSSRTRVATATTRRAPPTRGGGLFLAMIAASGAIALAAEILWTRALVILIGNSTYAFTVVLVAFLFGIAAGSAALSAGIKRYRDLPTALVVVFLVSAVWNLLAIQLFGAVGGSVYELSSRPMSLLAIVLTYAEVSSLLVPLAFCSGAIFPLVTRALDPDRSDAAGVSVSRASQWNTIGAVLGSLVAGFGLAKAMDYIEALYALSVAYAGVACAMLVVLHLRGGRRRWVGSGALLAAGLAVCGYAASRLIGPSIYVSRIHERFRGVEVMFHRPGLQGITTVLRRRGAPLAEFLLVNGQGMTLKVTDTKVMAHLPLLLHPDPKEVLVICFGMGTTYRSALTYGVHVTVIDLLPEVLEAFEYFHGDAPAIRANANGRMIATDGRNFLKLTKDRFDVITIDPPPPIDGAWVNHLYSQDFVRLAKSRLNPGGILAHWIPSPGNSGVDDEETFRLLVNTVATSFSHAVILKGYAGFGFHVLGSQEPLVRDRDWFERRLGALDPRVRADLQEWDPVTAETLATLEELKVRQAPPVKVLTDNDPTLEFYLVHLLSSGRPKSYPQVIW